MKKILSLLLILCILCLVGCGNGEPPTSNGGSGQNVAFADTEWAVYDGYGVTMEYPSTWTLYCYAESASAANYSVLMVSTAEDIFLRCYVIFQMTALVVCGECGHSMRRMHDSRTSFGEKWVCQDCGTTIKIVDEKLLAAVTECLNMAIADTRLIEVPLKHKEPSAYLRRLENEIGRLLDSSEMEKETLKNKIFECASLRYSEMDTTESVTEMLKAAFEKSGPLSQYNQELTERTVSSISLNRDGSICLTLKNGRQIRKENTNGTDCHNASKKSPHNPTHNSAGQCA